MSSSKSGEIETAEPAVDLRVARGRSTRAQLIVAATEVLREGRAVVFERRRVPERVDESSGPGQPLHGGADHTRSAMRRAARRAPSVSTGR
jgi:hypothetical protein